MLADRLKRLRRAAAYGAAVGLLGFALSLLPRVLELDETLGLGLLFSLRGPVAAPDSVVVVSISRESAEAVGQSTHLIRWPRTLHARLVDALSEAGVSNVAFDVLFKEARDVSEDRRFAEAIRAAGNVLLLEGSDSEPEPAASVGGVVDVRILPLEQFADAALATAPFALPTVPFDVGQFWTFGRTADATPSLPVVALQAHWLEDYDALRALLVADAPRLDAVLPATRAELVARRGLTGALRAIRGAFEADPALLRRLHDHLVGAPLDAARAERLATLVDVFGGPPSRYLNFYGPARTIRTIPYESVLAGPKRLGLAGKTVFVGYSEPRQPDQRDFFHSVFSQRSGINLSGVEIGATAFANMLERRSVVPLGRPADLVLVLLWGFALGTLLRWQSSSRAIGIAALAAAGGVALAYWAFVSYSIWAPLLVPVGVQVPAALAAALFSSYRELARERQRIGVALGYYVPAAEVRRLASEAASIRSENRLLYGTCLFTDAEQYTTVAESLRPEALAELMNDYYRVMFEVVERHGGFVSDTAGDSMVAVWAAAVPSPDSGARACRAALEILEAVEQFNRGRGGQRLPTRVGLESGEMLVGSLGAEQRLEYRAIGDIVNTASRIQGLNRLLGTQVLVSEAVLGESSGKSPWERRHVGTFLLRGKTKPVRLYELWLNDPEDSDRSRLCEAFAAALGCFRAGEWPAAERAFADLVEQFPADGPSRYYAALSIELAARAPAHWDGAIRIESK